MRTSMALARAKKLAISVACILGGLLGSAVGGETRGDGPGARPNVIMIFADDLGYGDLGCYGNASIRTPQLDRMAAEGQRWTSFYVAANVCTPSRAGLLTGRWPVRSGMTSDRRLVLTARAAGGLPDTEITLAELLRRQGYATGAIGKWHLGQQARYLPTSRGFSEFFGTPYSNDEAVSPAWKKDFARRDYWNNPLFYAPRSEYWDIPLLRNETELERPVEQSTLTQRYTQEAVQFVEQHARQPFFLYLAPNMPHVPLFASEGFRGRSQRGIYGDVVEELDAMVGRLLETVRRLRLEQNTLVIFSSDNGPWLIFGEHGGSAGALRDGKGTTWEGGHRVPAIFWWPGRIRAGGCVDGIGTTLDVFATVAGLAGAALPADRAIDGIDLRAPLLGEGPSPRQSMLYFRGTKIYAIRHGRYKAHFSTKPGFGPQLVETVQNPPLLFDLEHDPAEQNNIAASRPDIVAGMRRLLAEQQAGLTRGTDQLVEQLPVGR